MSQMNKTMRVGLIIFLLPIMAGLFVGCSEDPVQVQMQDSNSTDVPEITPEKNMNPQIFCQGSKCTSPGEPIHVGYPRRDYSYVVDPGFSYIDRLEIGIDRGPNQISNVIMPAGWSWQIVRANMPHNERRPTAPHGNQLNSNGYGAAKIVFTGPLLMTVEQFAFDSNARPHVVDWQAQNTLWGWNFSATWSQRIGRGPGPIHGPRRMPVPIDPTIVDPSVPQ